MVGLEYILFFVGIFLLIKGADYLVDGSSSLAKRFGVSGLIIGLTVVAFGTSMPELVVNLVAAFEGATEVAFGNIIGSNISNLLLVLGITASIYNIKVHYSTTWKEIPFSFLAVLTLFILANKFLIEGLEVFKLTRIDGIILLLFFSIFIYYAFLVVRRSQAEKEEREIEVQKRNLFFTWLMILGGAIALFIGGIWTVDGAVYIANQLGLSQFFISATIIALGTSLPELVTSIKAALKQEVDMAVGNIIGSNIFNILWILGITALIHPIPIPSFINIDIIILGIATIFLFVALLSNKKHQIERWQGILLVLAYIAYFIFLIIRG